jgi:hypothetical protein
MPLVGIEPTVVSSKCQTSSYGWKLDYQIHGGLLVHKCLLVYIVEFQRVEINLNIDL